MKKVLIMVILISIMVTGCTQTNNVSEGDMPTIQTEPTNIEVETIDKATIDNSFFFRNNVSNLSYKGNFLFNEFIESDVNLYIKELATLDYGKLYELRLDSVKGVPADRLNLGYFIVQEEKIYKFDWNKENLNKLKTSVSVPNDGQLICQENELKDALGTEEPGFHQYIEVNGDRREYHSYNNQVATGYYETFIWEKNKGLVNYRSGYGAENDAIELQLND